METLSIACSVAGIVTQAIETSTQIIKWLGHHQQIYSAQQFDLNDVSSFETEIEEIKALLKQLQSTVEAPDMKLGSILGRCLENTNDILAVLSCRQVAVSYEDFQRLALHREKYKSIHEKQMLLRQLLSNLVLDVIREWHNLEAEDPTRHIVTTYSNEYLRTCKIGNYVNRFPPAVYPRQPPGPMLIHLLTSNVLASNRELWKRSLENDILTKIYSRNSYLSSHIRILNPVWENNMHRKFLQRLDYAGMGNRKAEIHNAQDSNFQWICEASVDIGGCGADFRDWLSERRPSHSIFWITGKPGSGKSTLMKFLHESPKILRLLREDHATNANGATIDQSQAETDWNIGLTIASYFFDVSGMPIQRSLDGLLRSLIFQILSRDRKIIPAVAPSRWEALSLFDEDPKPLDSAELEEMLISILHHRGKAGTLLILIDGLDEYGEHSSYCEMLELLGKLAACQGVKVCVSSRPLPQFRDAIENAPSLALENCNREDVEHFVISKTELQLSTNPQDSVGFGFKEMLVQNLTTRASGCFLWASLVIKALPSKLADGESEVAIMHFVKNAPLDLNGLIRSFMVELDTSQPFVASTLRFISSSQDPVSPLHLAYMQMQFPQFALDQKISSLSQEKLDLESRRCIEGVVSKSWGLLDVSWTGSQPGFEGISTSGYPSRVKLAHRSVRDFIKQETTRSDPPSNDFAARYCAASLSLLKISTISDITIPMVLAQAIQCAHAVIFTRMENELPVVCLLDELEHTCNVLLEGIMSRTPLMSSEENTAAFDSFLVHQFSIQRWFNNYSMAPIDGMSTKVQQRVIALCLKYSAIFPTRSNDSLLNFKSHSPMPGSGSLEVCASLGTPQIWTPSFGENNTPQTSGSIEKKDMASLKKDVVIPLAQFKDKPPEIVPSHASRDNLYQDGFNPEDDDSSDRMSWDSFSSAGSSLEEDHPLLEFKEELTEVVFQGFMEFCAKNVDGDFKLSEVWND